MVHTNTNIRLTVTSVRQETAGYFSILFERPQNFSFESGDWIDLEFPGEMLKGGKTFSLSSSPTEPHLMITLREGISQFKKALATLTPGQQLTITQYGNDYGFHLRENRSSTLIAGGVGIAPFRSMLKEMVDVKAKNSVQLLYFNQTEEFLFQNELDEWQRAIPHLDISYVVTRAIKRKDREKILREIASKNKEHIFIAGPAGMVATTSTFLENTGVNKSDIRIDSFGGY